MTQTQDPQKSTDLVVMGSLGDLARRKLFPALYQLVQSKAFDQPIRILAITRSKTNREHFSQALLPFVLGLSSAESADSTPKPPEDWQAFLGCFELIDIELNQPTSYWPLAKALQQKPQADRIFYLAVPPDLYGTVTHALGQAQCIHQQSRVVLEKPIGKDLTSAKQINQMVTEYFHEDQIFRIDHYLGKETVQNIMALRFANTILEPIWCAQHIEYMQITVAESIDVGARIEYYEQAGALRDMIQNHLLQLLCIVAMEPPATLKPHAVRDEKIKVLRALRPIRAHDVIQKTVRGQYFDLHGHGSPSYRQTPGVDPESDTETFVAIKTELDNWRWAGMPIYLRTGKCLKQRHSEIVIQFKELPHKLFPDRNSIMAANRLSISLQPEESIQLALNGKAPGRGMHLTPLTLNLVDNPQLKKRPWDAYERLLLDIIHADLTLFMREQDITSAWQWVDPIIHGWKTYSHAAVAYAPGSWGPLESDQMLARDGYIWHNPQNPG